jgi:hypothetical protein
VFNRPGKIGNLGQFDAASQQLEGLLGGAFPGLASTNKATGTLFQQLPSILSQFALSRPTGNIDQAIDDFVKTRLESIAKSAPPGALDGIIDSIVTTLSAEAGGEGGQAKLINKILENTGTFSQELIDKSGAEALRKFQQEAADALIAQINGFAAELKEVSDREIEVRQSIVENQLNLNNQNEELQVLRDPRGNLRPDITEAFNRTAARQILDSAGLNKFQVGQFDPAGIEAERQSELRRSIQLQEQINNATDPNVVKDLGEQFRDAQGKAAALAAAFKLVTDTSARRAAIEQELSRAQQARAQLTGGFGNFIFGNRQQKAQLNLGAALTQLVGGANGKQNFRQLQNFQGDPQQELLGVLDNFLQQFSEINIPFLNGKDAKGNLQFDVKNLGQLRRDIIEEQLFPVFQDIIGRQFAPRDRKKNAALIDQQARAAAQQGADNAITNKEDQLIEQLAALNKQDFENQKTLLTAIGTQNATLVGQLGKAFDKFIADLNTNRIQSLLDAEKAANQARAVQNKSVVTKQNSFADIINDLGADRNNVNNLTALEFARRSRDLTSNINVEEATRVKALADDPVLSIKEREALGRTRQVKQFNKDFAVSPRLAAETLGTDIAGQLGIKDLNAVKLIVSQKVAEFTESQKNAIPLNRQSRSDLLFNVSGAVAEQALSEDRDIQTKRQALQAEIAASGVGKIVDAFSALNEVDFEKLTATVRDLGNVKIDELNKSIDDMNAAIRNSKVKQRQLIDELNKQNTPNQNGGPVTLNDAAQQFNQGLNGFVGQSTALVAAMDNFPRTVDLSATHRVEVVINGAQVLQGLMPAMQEIAIAASNDAISKFVKEKMPGAGAVG